ncbi:sodium/proline symporter PutP [Corynebacterium sp. TA-R-1]|uniref:Sodium/proline symporter n=1 Tax=Corynebacterium stercoris TaxID=2943490 RepID=A0ABT1G069_9CORY|nr:sodium/proline symporter PutP [Corynebacterium stercoris]MCP1387356.1 sodium/proline symporter PutP [Corynebacterium stercoris]
MTENFWLVLAIVLYFGVMVGIGFYSWLQTKKYDDYVLGDRGLNPLVAGLSAGASDMSGWLLMGLPGALFVAGMSELWIVIGLFIGTWANWKWVAPRLRSYTEVANNSITLPSFFENRTHDTSRILRFAAAVIIIFFFTFYVSSGMVSGGRYYESTFGGDYLTGMLIVGSITVLYTFIGGFLAVSYTDVVQGGLMFLALIIVPIMALFALDNPADIFTWATDNAYGPHPEGNPTYFNMVAGVSAATIIGNLAWGLGYFGQPHIVTRFMALRSPAEARSARRTGMIWVAICYIGAIFTALVSTVYFSQKSASVTDQTNFETIFLDLARLMFHPLIAGIILTAVLAAIMSTMSSQLLITSSALIEDLYRIFNKKPSQTTLLVLSRTMVVLVAIAAMLMAVNPSDTILGLVGFAWAGFGAAFGPVVVASLYWKRLTAPGAIAGMVVGALTVFIWGSVPATSAMIYEIVPGVIFATIAMVAVSLFTQPKPGVAAEFDRAVAVTEYALAHPEATFSDAMEGTAAPHPASN